MKYLIWTERGWLKTPNFIINVITDACDINITMDVRFAQTFTDDEAEHCSGFLDRYGIANWIVNIKE
jgi:hypothetical protein